jgi:hypothetical protein
MRKFVTFVPALVFLALALPALAQQSPANLGRVVAMVPKPGMAQQFEEGRKRHMEWHRKQNDTWAWETWQVQTGDASGVYLSITFGHTWKDFDAWEAKYAKGDEVDAAKNMDPYLVADTSSLWAFRNDVSRPPEGNEPSKMASVIHFILNSEGVNEFNIANRKIHEAIGKTNWPVHYQWYALVNGGEQPHFVLVLPHNSYAEMAPQEVSFEAMLEKAYGREDANALLRSLEKTIKRQWSEIIVYRPDLSYRPAAK